MSKKTVSVVLGSYNRKNFLKLTIQSVREEIKRCGFASEIIVVDGGSSDGSANWLFKQKDIVTIIQHNRGIWQNQKIKRRSWGYFMNLAFKAAQGKYICMVSDDCLVLPGAIQNGVDLFEKSQHEGKKIGAIAFYFRDWPGNDNYYVNKNFNKIYLNHGLYLNDALKKVGYIDEDNFTFYGADIDLSMKLYQAGYECITSPDSFIEHYAHANAKVRKSNNSLTEQDTENLVKKWEKIFGKLGGERVERQYSDPEKTALKKFFTKTAASNSKRLLTSPISTYKKFLTYYNEGK